MDIENGNKKKCFAMVVDKKTKNDFRRWKEKLSFFFILLFNGLNEKCPNIYTA